ncbi:MAG: FkbM family methyltransferase protein [Bacteroidota bacterium]|jgi:FkbM family methyltransferase|nr:FkbM family methyltransferase protein [Bacteroidota bacterium]
MASSFSIFLGNFLYKNCFPLYKLTYRAFKEKQDAFEISLMKKYIHKGDTVLDIGANIGFYAEVLSRIVGTNGTVHCFEPDATNFRHLQKRCQPIKNIIINKKAVSEKKETLKIYTSKKLNVDHRTYKPDTFDAELEIEAISIDEYIQSGQISSYSNVNFIKMDIQGFEMSAAKGMQATLQVSDVKLLSEFWPYGMKKAGSSVLEYFRFLKASGFYVYLIQEQQLVELNEEKVATFLDLPETTYMNIFAIKTRV